MNNIEWKDEVICFFDGEQHFLCGDTLEDSQGYTTSFYNAINHSDFQLNQIREGDFIPASDLDTEQKYNKAVEVFGLFGFFKQGSFNSLHLTNDWDGNIHDAFICKNGICVATWLSDCNKIKKRQLTYHQIIAIGKLKRMMLERAVPAVEFGFVADNGNSDQVKNPKHYQLIEGIESIEIIARSMTTEQWKGFCLGNMLKYRIRAGKKDALQQDIENANFYGQLYEMHKEKCYD